MSVPSPSVAQRPVLKLPGKSDDPANAVEEMVGLCKDMVNKRVVVTHKLGYLILGRLNSITRQCLRMSDVQIKSRDHDIKGVSLLVIRASHISHVNTDDGQPA